MYVLFLGSIHNLELEEQEYQVPNLLGNGKELVNH